MRPLNTVVVLLLIGCSLCVEGRAEATNAPPMQVTVKAVEPTPDPVAIDLVVELANGSDATIDFDTAMGPVPFRVYVWGDAGEINNDKVWHSGKRTAVSYHFEPREKKIYAIRISKRKAKDGEHPILPGTYRVNASLPVPWSVNGKMDIVSIKSNEITVVVETPPTTKRAK